MAPSTNPTIDPTSAPTQAPTSSPIVGSKQNIPRVILEWTQPATIDYFLQDPFSRFEATMEITVIDEGDILSINYLCQNCFVWQYKQSTDQEWIDIEYRNNPQISASITSNSATDIIANTLTIQSNRILYAGYCADENDIYRIFKPNNVYQLRLKVLSTNNEYIFSEISETVTITTNSVPSGGSCAVANIESIYPLQQFNINCNGWNSSQWSDVSSSLEYNALINDVSISNDYVSDPRQLSSRAPAGDIEITVLIRPDLYPSTVSCHHFTANFPPFEDVVESNSEIVKEILVRIDEIINTVSLAADPATATVLHNVIDSMYQIDSVSKERAQNKTMAI